MKDGNKEPVLVVGRTQVRHDYIEMCSVDSSHA